MSDADSLAPVERYELDEEDPYEGLTAKMQLFASLSFSGLSDVDAYRQSYDCRGMAPQQVAKHAAIQMKHPLVREKIRSLRIARDKQATLAPLLSREFVINGVMALATGARTEAVQLRAYELLGKTVGIDLFRETVVRETRQRTVEDVDRELKERLSALAPLIEGEAHEVKPADKHNPRGMDRRRKPRS